MTNYMTSCTTDNKIMKENGIKDQNEYRLFLQKNAEKLMQINMDAVVKK